MWESDGTRGERCWKINAEEWQWERGEKPVRFLQVSVSLTAVTGENKVVLNDRSSFLQ